MRLFNKTIDRQLFKQYPLGSDLSKQEVVAKIFNPMGSGTWFILNSDPNDPDYLWAIVDLGYGAEVGSVSRSDLETYRGRFGLGFERDLGFDPINAKELYNGLREGKFYANGGLITEEKLKEEEWFSPDMRIMYQYRNGRLGITLFYGKDRRYSEKTVINNASELSIKELNSEVKKEVAELKQFAKEMLENNFADGGELADFSDNQRMIMNQNVQLEHHHEELEDVLEDKMPIPAWVVAKMATATESVSDVTHYLDGQKELMEEENEEEDEDEEEVKNKEVVEPINVSAGTKAELTKKFTDDAWGNLKGFLKGMEGIELRDDYTFDYKNEQFEVEPIINSDENGVSNAVFSIFDGDGEEVGDVAYSREGGKQKFTANSEFFSWNNAKFEDGGFMNGVYADGGQVYDGVVDYKKASKLLMQYKPKILYYSDGYVFVDGIGLALGSLTNQFKGYGDSTDIKNLIWKVTHAPFDEAKANIEKFTKGEYTLTKGGYGNQQHFLKTTKKLSDGGYFDGTIPKVSTYMSNYADGGRVTNEDYEQRLQYLKMMKNNERTNYGKYKIDKEIREINTILEHRGHLKNSYAKGGITYFDDRNQHYLGRPSGSIEKEILEKVKGRVNSDSFVGSFGWRTSNDKYADGYLYKLDDFDKGLIKDLKLKQGEVVFRYVNRTTAIGGSTPFIKINIEKALLYFPVSNDNDDIIFETKSVKPSWINLIQGSFADGGFMNNVYADGGEISLWKLEPKNKPEKLKTFKSVQAYNSYMNKNAKLFRDEHSKNGAGFYGFESDATQQEVEKSLQNERDSDNQYADGGEVYSHKHSKGWGEDITIELLEPTAKGWKVKQTTKKGRKTSTKTAFFSKQEISDLFEKQYSNGGETEEGVDLFEDYDNIPDNLQKILDKYEDAFQDGDYSGLAKALKEANAIGYTFEYYLDGQAYDLRKIGEKGKSEFDQYAKGGKIKLGDIVEVKEPNYGSDSEYYVVDNKAGYDQDGFLISETRKREQGVFDEDQLNKLYAKGGSVKKEKVYIKFLNKDKNFREDTKYFDSYEEAVKWGRDNFERFDQDMINYSEEEVTEKKANLDIDTLYDNYYVKGYENKAYQFAYVPEFSGKESIVAYGLGLEDGGKKKKKDYESFEKAMSKVGEKTNSPKYILKADIKTVTVKRNGKEVAYKGADVLNGANILAKGGDLSSKANYIPKRDVVGVELNDGTTVKPVNGYWVKKGAEPIGAEPTPTASVKSETKVGETYIRKDARGNWRAETNVENFNDYDWRISTVKTYTGNLVSSAQGGKTEPTGSKGYEIFKYTMYQDPNHTLDVSKPKRLTDKVVKEQHDKALAKFKKFMETGMFKSGGKISNFDKLSAKVAKEYEGKPVKSKYQEEYGKYYSKEEAQEVGDKVAGKVKAMQPAKNMSGGNTSVKKSNSGTETLKKANELAKQIRKEGESWLDAKKRAFAQLKK